MNILLLGSGGREHALAWKLRQSTDCEQLYIAPGNAGTSALGTNLDFGVNDFAAITSTITEKNISLLVVGPEDPLVNGIYDHLQQLGFPNGVQVIGPSAHGAQLEGSKAFSKHFMERHGIPTASYAEFTRENFEAGKTYIQQHSLPIVLKADGLAAGKGVVIAETHEDALRTFESMIIDEQFGKASSKVVIESFLRGIEVSVFALTDGKDYKIIGHAKDYKRIGEGDTGPNTGGMGCVTPVPFLDADFMQKTEDRIIRPTINGLQKEGIDYKGFVFFGLMNVGGDPFVIEYNCRMGDPETEVVMPRLQNDLLSLLTSVYAGTLATQEIIYDERCIATVMAVSGGYPGDYAKGKMISGLDNSTTDSIIFHAGTTTKDGNVVTNGGRVLAVTSYGHSLQEAVGKSRQVLQQVNFEGMYFRSDIGYEFVI